MVRNRNPCLVEAQRGFCETHYIFMRIVLPAELTECKAEFLPVSIPSVNAFVVVCARGVPGILVL